MSEGRWRPSADMETLQARSRLMARLRAFFDARGYLEVDTPQLSRYGTTDPNIDSIAAGAGYMHTSPEFAMKRLLAAGSGPIYQICHVFRAGEVGRLHNPEFCMLEWYRPGFDHHQLMDEIEVLLQALAIISSGASCRRLTYAEAFEQALDLDPRTADLDALLACVKRQGIVLQGALEERDACLDLLMGEIVGSKLGLESPCFVYDYPASQAALARVRDGQPPVAERFELYWQGVELANGFNELCDAGEQRRRLQADVRARQEQGRSSPLIDEYFLQALENGLPSSAGVALGVDRLLMLMSGKPSVAEVLSFSSDRI